MTMLYDDVYQKVWVWLGPLSCKRNDPISAGDKLLLSVMWWRAPVAEHNAFVQVSRNELATATGSSVDKAKDQLRRLAEAGWIRRTDGGWLLAWRNPFPPAAPMVGHVYAVEFSNGTVKVGRSGDPERRLSEHAAAAGRFGLTITRRWRSGEFAGCDAVERLMLERLRSTWPPMSAGVEYFTGGFEAAVEAARAAIGEGE